MNLLPTRHVSISINRSMDDVYAYASNTLNLPSWASGLSQGSLKQEGGVWTAESPMGRVKIKFAQKNSYGILDHEVTLESGVTVSNPLRVFKNGEGSEIVFTLFRQPDMSDEKFDEDAKWVKRDLEKLKELLEQ